MVMDFGLGQIGNSFLSCEMAYVLFLSENKLQGNEEKLPIGRDKGKGKEAFFVQDNKVEEVKVLPAEVEASLALVMFQQGVEQESVETMLEGDNVMEGIPKVDVTCLNPVVIDGIENLLLD